MLTELSLRSPLLLTKLEIKSRAIPKLSRCPTCSPELCPLLCGLNKSWIKICGLPVQLIRCPFRKCMGGAGQESTLINKKSIQEEVQGWIFFGSSIGALRNQGQSTPWLSAHLSLYWAFFQVGRDFPANRKCGM